MTEERDQALRTLTEAWLALRQVAPQPAPVIVRAEVLRAGRPGLLDIVADVGGRLAHLIVGLRGVADEQHFLRAGEEAALGLLDDDAGLAVCTDALATRTWGPCCWPRSAASSLGLVPLRCSATTPTPPSWTAGTGATSWSSRGSPTRRDPTSTS